MHTKKILHKISINPRNKNNFINEVKSEYLKLKSEWRHTSLHELQTSMKNSYNDIIWELNTNNNLSPHEKMVKSVLIDYMEKKYQDYSSRKTPINRTQRYTQILEAPRSTIFSTMSYNHNNNEIQDISSTANHTNTPN
ncbi:MAG: hypothetical protein GY821_12285 [Gammaproteobacteria bacterium]|nr:hypothetical protein [Gammaproteobacteria bacterium]